MINIGADRRRTRALKVENDGIEHRPVKPRQVGASARGNRANLLIGFRIGKQPIRAVRATFRFAFGLTILMIAGNPIRARGVRVLLAFVFILLVILTILLLQEKRSPSTPSNDPPLHTAVYREHLSAT